MGIPMENRADVTRQGDSNCGLAAVIDGVLESAQGQDEVAIRDLLEAFSGRSYGPLLMVPGLAMATPLGAIPGVPIVFGVLAAWVGLQLLVGRSQPWVPGWMVNRSIDREQVVRRLKSARPWCQRVDRWIRRRWVWVVQSPMVQVVGLVAVGMGASTIPLAVVPWGVTAPGIALCLLGLGLMAQDGVAVGVGTGLGLLTLGMMLRLV